MEQIYERLDPTRREIRLLKILPLDRGQVSCALETVSLEDNPCFVALSYVWNDPYGDGSPPVFEDIMVNGVIMSVTKNLASALRHVEKHWHEFLKRRDRGEFDCMDERGDGFTDLPPFSHPPFRLWADALCINQADLEERGHQVQLMKNTYQSAALVISWLAPEDGHLPLACETVKIFFEERLAAYDRNSFTSLQWMKRYPSLYEDIDGDNRRWKALRELNRLGYWTRVWVVQEAVLARRRIYACPSYFVASKVMVDGMRGLSHCQAQLTANLVLKPDFFSDAIWTTICHGLPLLTFGITLELAKSWWRAKDVTRLGIIGKYLTATDRRDYVYGLLGLTEFSIVPDYSKDVAEVHGDLVSSIIASNSNTEAAYLQHVLCETGTTGADMSRDQPPSWVPTFSEQGGSLLRTGSNSSELVFEPDTPGPMVCGRSLFVTCIEASHIQQLSHSFKPIEPSKRGRGIGQAIIEFVQMCSTRHVSSRNLEATTIELVYRTMMELVAFEYNMNRFFQIYSLVEFTLRQRKTYEEATEGTRNRFLELLGLPSPGPLRYRIMRACFPQHPETLVDEDIESWREKRNYPTDRDLEKDVVEDEVLRLSRYLNDLGEHWGFFLTDDGFIGLAPSETQVGDMVCILHRCARPDVLRKVDDYYVHIGQTFVLGLMEGEAKRFLEDGQASIKRIELR